MAGGLPQKSAARKSLGGAFTFVLWRGPDEALAATSGSPRTFSRFPDMGCSGRQAFQARANRMLAAIPAPIMTLKPASQP
jgi:hypothetical protein